ncbi:LacI family DNA-binding transcriptional regulator [Nonomuraea phyllanthi]|uniref:LacI family DNA-binding transcriptional regulator n=1 Tax=Nonomuraea phyllanthi TaxID=2219224 RepID=A0A5C4WSE1_9ACTN|nr:LacI family DNA-binding transcriptional regulator [Nonomuraea phyllanthi]KAB8195930.1 LacI family DNA-binding transcriptional regulator [Nonomuraea phyllanthi]QFY07385.1 LacI family DNA-binding transcriptional regulator [Nonomuraea phyllanthi]
MRPTARQVAELANVSVATVSYVLSGRDRPVAAETRQRVLDAARQLGYTPNQAARSLRKRRTQRVCLVLSSLGGVPSDERLATDLHEMADARGYSVVTLAVYSEARAKAAVDVLRGGIADGALVNVVGDHLTHDLLSGLAATGLPMVVLSNESGLEGCDVVRTPEAEACAEAVEHLLAQGRRRIAFLAHRHELYRETAGDRLLGYTTALERHGVTERIITSGADDRVSAYQTAAELLRSPDRPDAIFAASDRAAISAIWAARDAGLSVPGDVAIIGVGNIDEGLISNPQLSTVGPLRHDYTDVVRLLFDRLQAEEPPPAREIVRSWTFLPRSSS